VQALTAGVIAGLSDVIAQRLTSRKRLNLRRTLCIVLWGLVWTGWVAMPAAGSCAERRAGTA
jgi:hypothetical protein